MAGVFVILPFNHVNGTVADANEVMANNAAMRDGHNNSLHGTTGHTHDGTNWNGPKLGAGAIDLNVDFNWTGIHTYLCSKLRVKGAGVGTVGFCYENTGNNRTHTIRAGSGDDYFVLEGAIQTLTNKTLTSPIINTSIDMSAGNVTVALNNSTNALNFNSDHVVFDGTNKKIGIGTTSLVSVSTGGLKTLGDIASSGTTTAPQSGALGYLNAYNGVHMIGGGSSAGGQFVNSGFYNVTSFTRNAAGDYTILMPTQTLNSLSKAFSGLLNASIASNKHGSQIISTTTTTVQVSTLDDGGIALDADYTVGLIGAT